MQFEENGPSLNRSAVITEMKEFSVIFIHIPKTAGTTLRAIIEDCFSEDQIHFIYLGNRTFPGMDEFLELSEESKRNIKIFCGHVDFGFHRNLPQTCKYITVLRKPVERTVSLYNHLLQEENARTDQSVADMQDRIKSANMSLQDFVCSGITVDTDNAQTRILSGESPPFGQCRREILEKAKNNLREHFIVAGITEKFDESVMLMHKILGWPLPFYVRQNISADKAKKQIISQATLDTIKQYNEFDAELYSFAGKLLDEQVQRQGASFRKEVEEFMIANRYYGEWFNKMDSFKVRSLQLRIDDLLNSWSWKVTAPMRKFIDLLNKVAR